MEFTIWSESSHSDKNDGSDIHSVGGHDEFVGAINSMTSPQRDPSARLKTKSLSNEQTYEFDDFNEQDPILSPWNMVPSDIGSGLTPGRQGLAWETDFQALGGNSSVEENNATGGTATFDDVDEAKELLGGDDFSAIGNTDAESKHRLNHKRGLSDTYTMRVPLVTRSHNDTGDGVGQDSAGMNLSPEMLSGMMQTPVRGDFTDTRGQNQLLDGLLAGSPDFGGSRLDSPLESPALQSPYLAYQPFPMLPTTSHPPNTSGPSSLSTPNHVRKFSNAGGSPRIRRKSSSESQSSMTSPMASEAHEVQSAGPQTPRARAANEMKIKQKKSAPFVTATPNSISTSHAGDTKNGDLNTNSPSSGQNTTPRMTSDSKTSAPNSEVSQSKLNQTQAQLQNQTQTPTPAREGKKDGRKRIAKKQIDILEASFHQNPRPEREDRLRLAAETGLEQRTVQIWFQNRRAKSRSMKMPPSKADTSLPAMQFRAAVAAASNAVANSPGAAKYGSKPNISASPGMDFNQWGNTGMGNVGNGYGPSTGFPSHLQRNNSSIGVYNRTSSLTQMSPLAAGSSLGSSNYSVPQQYPARPSHQRWNSVSAPSTQPLVSYHQQLPKYGVPQGQSMNSPLRLQQYQHMDQVQQLQMEQASLQQQQQQSMMNQMSPQMQQSYRGMSQGSYGIMSPPLNRSNSSSKFEPYMNYRDMPDSEYDFGSHNNGMSMNSRAVNRSDSVLSLASMNSNIPPSPLSADNMAVFGADLSSMQSSQEPKAVWPGPARNHSLVSLSESGFDQTGIAPGSTDGKRRRSLYGSQIPNWNAHYEEPFASSITPSRLSPTNYSDSHSSGSSGSLAASAAVAALRTRNRSHTQPTPRSRQHSIRLQLDESNHAAQLVVLPDEQDETMTSGSIGNMPFEGYREMSPGSAEQAAERLLSERAAATVKFGPSMPNE